MPKIEIEDTELAALRASAKAGEKAQALADGLQAKLAEAQASAGKVPDYEARIKAFETAALDSTFKGAGITDPKVRRIFELEHSDVAPAADGSKPVLDKWLSDLQALPPKDRPAHLAPFLPAPQVAGAPPPRVAAGLPDASKGALPVQGAPAQFTAEAIKAMSPDQYRENRTAILAANPEIASFFPSQPVARA
jgi:hypothetical protein